MSETCKFVAIPVADVVRSAGLTAPMRIARSRGSGRCEAI
jgi:hypothetical protein